MKLTEQATEVVRWCRQIAKYTEVPGETTRRFLSKPMREVHTALAAWMARAGMTVRVDAMGNIRGFYPPAVSTTPAAASPRLYIGSHLDTVPRAGAFDGILGVVMGVALVELLDDKHFSYGIEIVGFSDEEGVRFGTPFLGSRALVGSVDPALLDLRDQQGRTVREAIRDFGLDAGRIADARASSEAIGYLEFHIEQGPVLEDLNLPLGVVDTIAGQSRATATFTGVSGHAGTTPMKLRKDALAGGAEWLMVVEQVANATSGLVATVGRLEIEPGAGNVIPSRAVLSLDVRHPSDQMRRAAFEQLQSSARQIASRRGLELAWDVKLDQASVSMDPKFASMLDRAVEGAGQTPHRMTSGAGHDAMVVASRMSAGMVFLRCDKGISHHPDERVREEDVAAGLDAGLRFFDEVARSRHV